MKKIIYFYNQGLFIKIANQKIIKLENKYQEINLEIIKQLLINNNVCIDEVVLFKFYDEKLNAWIKLTHENEKITSKSCQIMLCIKGEKKKDKSQFDKEDIRSYLSDNLKIIEKKTNLLSKKIQNNLSIPNSENNLLKGTYNINSTPLFLPHSSSSFNVHHKEKVRQIDVAFLFSNPLVNISGDFLNNPFDFEKDLTFLIDDLRSREFNITASYQVASMKNLIETLGKRPKVIHFFCNGGYKNDEFYCFFENDYGKLDLVSMNQFKEIFTEKMDKTFPVELIIISSFFTEPFLDIFQKINLFKAIITLHNYSLGNDDSFKLFTSHFYSSLFDGKSIKASFEDSKHSIKGKQLNLCCCYHMHSPHCRWKEIAIRDHKLAHSQHLLCPKCSYDNYNVHKTNCSYAISLIENFEYKDVDNTKIICCCCVNLVHNKSKKFELYLSENYIDIPIYDSELGKFELTTKNYYYDLKFNFEIRADYIGRSRDIVELINLYFLVEKPLRFLTVTGVHGIGKTTFAKITGVYLYERNFFPDGVIFIDNKSDMSDNCLESLICNSLEIEKCNNKDFYSLIENLRILFIFRFSKKKDDSEFIYFLHSLLNKTNNPKILIVSDHPLGIKDEFIKEIEPLSNTDAAILLKLKGGENVFVGINQDVNILKDHKIIQLSRKIPAEIINIAHWLKIYKIQQIEENYEKATKQPYSEKFIKEKFKESSDIIKEVFYLICILPRGIFETDLLEMYGFENYLIIQENLVDISQSGNLITIEEKNKETSLKHILFNADSLFNINSLELDISIKIKSLEKLISWYICYLRMILFSFFNDNPNEFSAGQNYGMWKSFSSSYYPEEFASGKNSMFWINNDNKSMRRMTKIQKSSCVARYNYYEDNIFKILEEIKREGMLTESLKEGIAQCSICIPTLLFYFKRITDCFSQGSHLMDLLKDDKINLDNEYNRLKLFYNGLPIKKDKTVFENDFMFIKDHYEKKKIKNGIAENYFSRIMFNIREISKNEKKSSTEIMNDYQSAYSLFNEESDYLSIARINFCVAEFELEYCYLNKEALHHSILLFEEAEKHFKEYGRVVNQYKSLLRKGDCYIEINEFDKVKAVLKEVENFLLVLKKVNDDRKKKSKNAVIDDVYDIINSKYIELDSKMKDKIQNQSRNLFTFMKAHQLVRIIQNNIVFGRTNSDLKVDNLPRNSDINILSPIVNIPQHFKKKVKEILKNSKQKIDFCFENLEINNFKKIISLGGKFLHLCSEDYSKEGSLFLENKLGESYEIIEEELEAYLNNAKFTYDIVVLSIYQSKNLANIFHNKVNNVIYFKFNDDFLKYALDLPCHSLLKVMNDFTIYFLGELIKDCNIRVSFEESKKRFSSDLSTLCKAIKRCFNQCFEIEEAVFLISNEQKFTLNLEIFEGNYLQKEPDLSKVRKKPINLKKRTYPFINRKKLIHDILYELFSSIKILNIYGESGVGKTELVKELGYYAYQRNYYSSIYYFTLKSITSIEALKALFNEHDLNNIITNNPKKDFSILIILDDCDYLIRTNNNQFYLLINSLDHDHTYFILSSIEEIKSSNLPCMKKLVLGFEKEEEYIYMFLNCCKRNIIKSEIDIEETSYSLLDDSSLIDLLKRSFRIRKCGGLPKYIKMLADRCSTISLKYVKIDFISDKINHFIENILEGNKTFTSPHSFNIISKLRQIETNRSSNGNSSVNSPNTSMNKGKKNTNFNFILPYNATQTVFLKRSNDIQKRLSGIEEKEEEITSRKESRKENEDVENEIDINRIAIRGKNSIHRQKSESLEIIKEEFSLKKKESKLNLNCPFNKTPETDNQLENNITAFIDTRLKKETGDNLNNDSIEPTSNNLLSSVKNNLNEKNRQQLLSETISIEDTNSHISLNNFLTRINGKKNLKVKITNNLFENHLAKKAKSEKIDTENKEEHGIKNFCSSELEKSKENKLD